MTLEMWTTGLWKSSPKYLLSALVGMCLVGGVVDTAVAADPLPGDVEISDLALTRDWVLVVDGVELENADVFYSEYEVAWLVTEPDVGTLLISPRGSSVQAVSSKSLGRSELGAEAVLKAGSVLRRVATFQMAQGVMSFDLDGLEVRLEPAPPLLGRQSFGAVEDRHPSFERKSADYGKRLAAKNIAKPFKSLPEDVVVRVYFGSWSPICDRIVPKIIAVEKAWSEVRFEYYGVPKVIPDDEQARRDQITGVPTVVVLSGETEVDRITGRRLDDPAEAIGQALSSF